MTTAKAGSKGNLSLRHAVATLGYRRPRYCGRRGQSSAAFERQKGSRSAGEILSHMGDLFDWALSQAQGKQRWRNSKSRPWNEDTARFFSALKAFDKYLASSAKLHAAPEKMFQGAVADALTHTGQIAMLRRLAGARVRGENYYVAKIEVGRIDPIKMHP